MITALQQIDPAKDYRASMQQAALGYLQRHQGEHLLNDGSLFERTSHYLVHSLEVPAFMAPGLVHLAMTQLAEKMTPRVIGFDPAPTGDQLVVFLVDLRSGERVPIPRRILPQRFLADSAAS